MIFRNQMFGYNQGQICHITWEDFNYSNFIVKINSIFRTSHFSLSLSVSLSLSLSLSHSLSFPLSVSPSFSPLNVTWYRLSLISSVSNAFVRIALFFDGSKLIMHIHIDPSDMQRLVQVKTKLLHSLYSLQTFCKANMHGETIFVSLSHICLRNWLRFSGLAQHLY